MWCWQWAHANGCYDKNKIVIQNIETSKPKLTATRRINCQETRNWYSPYNENYVGTRDFVSDRNVPSINRMFFLILQDVRLEEGSSLWKKLKNNIVERYGAPSRVHKPNLEYETNYVRHGERKNISDSFSIAHNRNHREDSDLIDMITRIHLDPFFEFVICCLIAATPSKHMVRPDVSTHDNIHSMLGMHWVKPSACVTKVWQVHDEKKHT